MDCVDWLILVYLYWDGSCLVYLNFVNWEGGEGGFLEVSLGVVFRCGNGFWGD